MSSKSVTKLTSVFLRDARLGSHVQVSSHTCIAMFPNTSIHAQCLTYYLKFIRRFWRHRDPANYVYTNVLSFRKQKL